jgi:hypothetical protein
MSLTIPFVETLEEAICVRLDIEELETRLAHEFDCATCPQRPACADDDCEIGRQESEKVAELPAGAYSRALFVLDQSRRFRRYDKRPKRWTVEFAALVDCAQRTVNARSRAKLARERAKRERKDASDD